ncbi:MAG: sulfate reduction electron transfer complex DsrMKJOP subunit DsrM, partial [Deltaproteobacteria bacterium]|nr:sulfate reduction electron transfer complex DsrMKJOP subunit DsrM [Deltaproteobacteria bacterium]
MKAMYALMAVLVLGTLAALGAQSDGLRGVLAIGVPYLALVLFVGGLAYRVVKWARVPVPFRVPSTCGQQRSLAWIKPSRLDNPHDLVGVLGRMALEVLVFRSLFRNTSAELGPVAAQADVGHGGEPEPYQGPRLAYGATKWLWAAGLAFHYSMLVVLLRHLRFFTEPVPWPVSSLAALDGFLQVGVPTAYVTSALLLAAVTYLLLRRLVMAPVRYISLCADYFPLLLILGIGTTGVLLRHFVRTDIVAVKELALSLVSFQPTVPAGIGSLFYVHLFLVCVLFAYFPWSKL